MIESYLPERSEYGQKPKYLVSAFASLSALGMANLTGDTESMIRIALSTGGTALQSLGGIDYLVKSFHGKEKPNRTTWLLWSVIYTTILASQIHQGVGIESLGLTAATAGVAVGVLGTSLIKHKEDGWKFTNLDKVCIASSLTGLALLLSTGNGESAIGFGIATDFLAAVPALTQALKSPNKEAVRPWLTALIGTTMVSLSLPDRNFATAASPYYLMALNGLFVLLNSRKPSIK